MTRDFTKPRMAKKSEEDFKVELGKQLDNAVMVADELYHAYADDFREDLVNDALCRVAGFVPKDKDVAASWPPMNHEEWCDAHATLEELKEQLGSAETPVKTKKRSILKTDRVSFADESGDEKSDADEDGGTGKQGPTPAELAANQLLVEQAKARIAGATPPADENGQAGGLASGKLDWSRFDLPEGRVTSSGFFFDANASGVPTLSKRECMTFERWLEWSGHVCDDTNDRVLRKAYRNYVNIVVGYSKEIPWSVLSKVDQDIRAMIKSGELDGFDDLRIVQRFMMKLRPGGSKKPGGGKDGPDWKALGVCKFFNSKKGCSKGDKCPFKHEKI
mmetsp:Transcript_15698/g.18916  ORF Transcript_15698/g.18916 Transcript_15698/m.18916 type:complete len:333 (-) Transcript_15698:337-1335(-)